MVVKPVSSKWNKKAKKAASMVAKGTYKKRKRIPFIDILWNPLVALIDGPEDMVQNNTAPGASEGDSYKIFNQAETESQKMMGEAAAQPCFRGSIRILVSTLEETQSLTGLQSIVAASSIFTDEYNNSLDNPQFWEDGLKIIF